MYVNKTIFIICGKSGVGKTTLINELCSRYNLKTVESYTTRPKRTAKENHIFITMEEMNLLPDKLFEFEFAGHHYCITNEQLNSADLFGLPPNACKDLYEKRNYFSNRFYIIYIKVSDDVRYERMLRRNDTNEWIAKRMSQEEKYFFDIENYVDKIVNNYDFEKCIGEIERCIFNEK